MKFLFVGIFLSVWFTSALAEEIRQFCMTDPRSTTFAVVTNDQIVKVGFMHHRGAEFAPIHNGLITSRDLPLLAERGEMLKQLGNYVEFDFPLEKCTHLGDFNFSCMNFRGEAKEINGHQVKGFAAYSAIQSETSFAGDYSYAVVNLSVEIDGKSYHIPMKYDLDQCAIDFQKKDFPFFFSIVRPKELVRSSKE